MRKIIHIIFLLSFQFVFSQIKNIENKTLYKKSLHNIILFEYKHDVNNHLENIFSEVIELDVKDIQKNSEGKFGVDSSRKNLFKTKENTTQVLIFYKSKNPQNSNLILEAKEKFITKVIAKKLDEEIEKYILNNEALTYGDRNIAFYKNYTELKNKLLVRKTISESIQIQIGKDIYPYLNKILKTELDKTIQNSLNVLAINF